MQLAGILRIFPNLLRVRSWVAGRCTLRSTAGLTSRSELAEDSPYDLTPQQPLGAVIHGFNLRHASLSRSTIERLRADVYKHHLLILKNQVVLEAADQIKVTQWFGEVDDVGIVPHACSPDFRIQRVANDINHGQRALGCTGFHVDGSFMENPNSFALYHIIQAPRQGATLFVSLNDVYMSVSERQRRKWDSLWICQEQARMVGYSAESPSYVTHPLVYSHPVTRHKVMVFHLGKTDHFVYDFGSQNSRKTDSVETAEIVGEIKDAMDQDGGRLIYTHRWESGDFLISDNLALAHMADSYTQRPLEEVGLRIMHRTKTTGISSPRK